MLKNFQKFPRNYSHDEKYMVQFYYIKLISHFCETGALPNIFRIKSRNIRRLMVYRVNYFPRWNVENIGNRWRARESFAKSDYLSC